MNCMDGCGVSVADQSEAEANAWRFLEISKRWRCPDCVRALDQINEQTKIVEPVPLQFEDPS